MILSIIICSRTEIINDNLSANIKSTVGCDYELIVIDNSQNKHSIFEAYNLGIDKSTGEYLCFIHDDILFHTLNWGQILNEIFEGNKKIGLIGIAGAKSKTKMPSLWWSCPKEDKLAFIIQHIPNREIERWSTGFKENSIEEVVAIDGVFMALKKNSHIRFNSEMKGFHNYDLNLSIECKMQGHKIMVTNAILIEHFSLGTIEGEWFDSSYQLFKRYKNNLPLNLENNKRNKKREIYNAIWFINECIKLKKYDLGFSIWRELFWLNPLLLFHVIYWKNNFKNNTNLAIEYFFKK